MKKIFTVSLITMALFSAANANNKFSNLTEDYLTTKASLNVRTTLAKDSETATNVLKVLANDSNEMVREYAKKNLK